MPPTVTKVIGPPGTGKTTYLLRQVEKAREKYNSEEIGFVSFTRAAINEAKRRLEFPQSAHWFRTIHSTAFRLLDLRKEMIAESYIDEFQKETGWKIALSLTADLEDAPAIIEQDFSDKNIWDRMNILRNAMIPFEQWPQINTDIKKLYLDWTAFKEKHSYYDFTDILTEALRLKLCPPVSCLFVDECQDLSALQLSLAQMWAAECDHAIYVGDADQTIYKWAGACPEIFLSLSHQYKRELKKSFRLPQEILQFSLKLIRQNKLREDVLMEARDGDQGEVRFESPDFIFNDLEALPEDKNAMILCRCNFQINRIINELKKRNIPFYNPYRPSNGAWNPLKTGAHRAIHSYLKLRKQDHWTPADIFAFFDYIKVSKMFPRGAKKAAELSLNQFEKDRPLVYNELKNIGFLKEFLDGCFLDGDLSIFDAARVSSDKAEYLKNIPLGIKPRIIVGTVHSVKGGQADNVYLCSEITKKIYDSLDTPEGQEDERRVQYVGVTRAKEKLFIIRGDRQFEYDF